MSTPVFIAGQYTGTLGGAEIGMTREGYHIRVQMHEAQMQTDEGGQSNIDGTDQGGDVTVTLDWCEYDKVYAALTTQSPALTGMPLANVGKLSSTLSQALVLTPIAGLSATAKTFTATKARVVTDIDFMINSKIRTGPLTLRLLPDFSLSSANYGRTHVWS